MTYEREGERPQEQRWRKKPEVVGAMRYEPHGSRALEQWSGGVVVPSPVLEPTEDNPSGEYVQIETLEGCMTAVPGDWIIKGVAGEFYPCKPDIFEATYEPADRRAMERCPCGSEAFVAKLDGVRYGPYCKASQQLVATCDRRAQEELEEVKDVLAEFAAALQDHDYGGAPCGPDLDMWAARLRPSAPAVRDEEIEGLVDDLKADAAHLRAKLQTELPVRLGMVDAAWMQERMDRAARLLAAIRGEREKAERKNREWQDAAVLAVRRETEALKGAVMQELEDDELGGTGVALNIAAIFDRALRASTPEPKEDE